MISEKKINKDKFKLHVLISPLDWGLGHATRCIPIINELIKLNCEVTIAADKKIFLLLKKEFPTLNFLQLKGYEIKYTHNKRWLFFRMLSQFPKIFLVVRNEKKWLKKIINKYHIDAVISDNRFGMYINSVPCIYITHQLFIETGNTFSTRIANKIHNFFIEKYTNCWVPDTKENGLAGKLSHPKKIPPNVIYIGPLSRFKILPYMDRQYDLLISISGPEPQRTIFEKMILSQLKSYSGKALIVRGLPDEKNILPGTESIKIINHLSSEDLNKAFQQSEMIISRSGYTTIMDLIKLKKSAILVPTPGQTEQEYLAKYLTEKKYFYSVEQEGFSLKDLLKDAAVFAFTNFDRPTDLYKEVINEFVLSIKTSNFAPQ